MLIKLSVLLTLGAIASFQVLALMGGSERRGIDLHLQGFKYGSAA